MSLLGNHNIAAEHTESHCDVFFTVVYPSGSLSVTANHGARLQRIDVTDVSRLDEAQLGEEIVELATLSREKAQTAQHEVTVELMSSHGQDRVGVTSFLMHSIGLPTYEATTARASEVSRRTTGSLRLQRRRH